MFVYNGGISADIFGIDHTIPPYAFGLVCTLSFCRIADIYKNKWFFISLFAGINTIFFIIVTVSTNHVVRCKQATRSTTA